MGPWSYPKEQPFNERRQLQESSQHSGPGKVSPRARPFCPTCNRGKLRAMENSGLDLNTVEHYFLNIYLQFFL